MTQRVARGRGRPEKGPDEKAEMLIRVRVTADQKRVLTAAAARAGLDLSSWMRTLAMTKAHEMGID